jgi:hypothetical protein
MTGKIVKACRHVVDSCQSTASDLSSRRRRDLCIPLPEKTASCKRRWLTPPGSFSSSHHPTAGATGCYPQGCPPGFYTDKDLFPHDRLLRAAFGSNPAIHRKWGLILSLPFMVAATTGNEKPRYPRVNIAGQAYPQQHG